MNKREIPEYWAEAIEKDKIKLLSGIWKDLWQWFVVGDE